MVLLKIAIAVVAVVLCDWLAVTRCGAYFADFDYRYWPPSRSRVLSVVLLAGTAATIAAFMRPDPVNPPLWPLAVGGPVVVVWMVVAILDMLAQRRAGYQTPPRYSD